MAGPASRTVQGASAAPLLKNPSPLGGGQRSPALAGRKSGGWAGEGLPGGLGHCAFMLTLFHRHPRGDAQHRLNGGDPWACAALPRSFYGLDPRLRGGDDAGDSSAPVKKSDMLIVLSF